MASVESICINGFSRVVKETLLPEIVKYLNVRNNNTQVTIDELYTHCLKLPLTHSTVSFPGQSNLVNAPITSFNMAGIVEKQPTASTRTRKAGVKAQNESEMCNYVYIRGKDKGNRCDLKISDQDPDGWGCNTHWNTEIAKKAKGAPKDVAMRNIGGLAPQFNMPNVSGSTVHVPGQNQTTLGNLQVYSGSQMSGHTLPSYGTSNGLPPNINVPISTGPPPSGLTPGLPIVNNTQMPSGMSNGTSHPNQQMFNGMPLSHPQLTSQQHPVQLPPVTHQQPQHIPSLSQQQQHIPSLNQQQHIPSLSQQQPAQHLPSTTQQIINTTQQMPTISPMINIQQGNNMLPSTGISTGLPTTSQNSDVQNAKLVDSLMSKGASNDRSSPVASYEGDDGENDGEGEGEADDSY